MSDQPTTADLAPPRVNPMLVLWLGVLSLSTGSILVRWCESPPLVTAAWRMTIAAAAVLPFALGRARSELAGLSRRELGTGMLSGALLALHFATWISSLGLTSVAASTVLVNTAPVWVALCAPWFTGDRTRWTGWIGIASSLAGGAVIGFGDFAGDRNALRGDALALAGGIALALYLVAGRRLRARTSLVAYLAISYTTAALLLWVCVCCAEQAGLGFSGRTWAARQRSPMPSSNGPPGGRWACVRPSAARGSVTFWAGKLPTTRLQPIPRRPATHATNIYCAG